MKTKTQIKEMLCIKNIAESGIILTEEEKQELRLEINMLKWVLQWNINGLYKKKLKSVKDVVMFMEKKYTKNALWNWRLENENRKNDW